ncbi:MAG: glycosyltransferase family 2 protein [Candidatus Sumerlaeota bacterium]|nr:glycosyltransferase family 2 protein [Candidatus Sumerlaeota bacterium]
MVRLSIISICLNEKDRIEQTILSVLQQTFNDYEFIIVDGGSTDGTVDVIRRYQDRIGAFISEKDNGIYNAMNKGIRRSSGEYLLFLNGGDHLYTEDVLQKVFAAPVSSFMPVPAQTPAPADADIIYGNAMLQGDAGESVWDFSGVAVSRRYTGTLAHPASFIKKRLFDEHGLYDESYRIVGDYAFFLREICRYGVTTRFTPHIIAVSNIQGLSCDPRNLPLINREKKRAVWRNVPFLIWLRTQVAVPWYLAMQSRCRRITQFLKGGTQ